MPNKHFSLYKQNEFLNEVILNNKCDEYFNDIGVHNFYKIADLIEKLFQKWLQNPNILLLNRKDLEYYISVARLKEQIINLKLN